MLKTKGRKTAKSVCMSDVKKNTKQTRLNYEDFALRITNNCKITFSLCFFNGYYLYHILYDLFVPLILIGSLAECAAAIAWLRRRPIEQVIS